MFRNQTDPASLDHNLTDESLAQVQRLHALIKLASSSLQSIRASRVANDGVSVLGARACIFQLCDGAEGFETVALFQQRDLRFGPLEQALALAAAEVTRTRAATRLDNLAAHFPQLQLAAETEITAYLGVPLFDEHGLVAGVAAVVGAQNRSFDETDEWWLRIAGQFVSAALACEAVEKKFLSLEQAPAYVSALSGWVAEAAAAGAANTKSSKPSVLVVDDDRGVNNVLRRFFLRKNYQVDSAFDGLEALRLFQPAEHDVVISDIIMPHMNGWELIAALQKKAPQIPVILITGYSNNSGTWNQAFLRQQGVRAILNKPIDFDYLAGVLEDILGVPRD